MAIKMLVIFLGHDFVPNLLEWRTYGINCSPLDKFAHHMATVFARLQRAQAAISYSASSPPFQSIET